MVHFYVVREDRSSNEDIPSVQFWNSICLNSMSDNTQCPSNPTGYTVLSSLNADWF